MKKYKILYVIESLERGGAEIQLKYLVENISKDYTPVILTLNKRGSLANELQRKGFEVVNLSLNSLSNPLCIIKNIIKIKEIIKQINPDLIHSQIWISNFFCRIIANKLKIPIICAERNIYPNKKWVHKKMDNLLSKRCECIITNSKTSALYTSKTEKIPLNRFRVIPNGIDLSKFQNKDTSIRSEFKISDKTTLLVNVASLTKQKAHHLLIKAFKIINSDNPNTKLLIVGEGPLRKSLENQINETRLSDKIILTGSRKDIPDILTSSDVFVFTSFYEGMPNAVMEAMASRIPIVALTAPGVNELLSNNHTAILIEKREPGLFAEAVSSIIKNKDQSNLLVKNAYDKVKKYSIKEMVSKYELLYEKILSTKN